MRNCKLLPWAFVLIGVPGSLRVRWVEAADKPICIKCHRRQTGFIASMRPRTAPRGRLPTRWLVPERGAVQELQHASDPETILKRAYRGLSQLHGGHLAQALLRIAKPLTQQARAGLKQEMLQDPRLADVFSAIHAHRGLPNMARHAAHAVWACGLLGWCPDRSSVKDLARLVEQEADRLPTEDVTSAAWALERLGLAGVENGAGWGLREREKGLPFRVLQGFMPELSVEALFEEVDFRQDEIRLGDGKVLSESRLTAWQSTGALAFSYSGKEMPPSPMTVTVAKVRDTLRERLGVDYDGVLINYYADGKCGMRFHSDPGQGEEWTEHTCVVSVGDTRQFVLREAERERHGRRHVFFVSSGDVVYMFGDCQQRYQHCVKVLKEAGDAGPRISLVFKQSMPRPAAGADS